MIVSFLKKNQVRSLFVFLTVFLIYFLLPNQNFTHDCLDYAIAVRDGKYLFHPHHLLYNALGRTLFLLCSVDALTLLQIVSAISMALCVSILYYILLQRKGNTIWVYFFASTNAVVFCGTSPEMYSVTMLFTLLSWFPYLVKNGKNMGVIYSAFAAALAMLFHQTAIFSVLVLTIAYYKKSKFNALIFFSISFLITSTAYIYAASINGIADFSQLIKWLTEYTHLEEASGGAWGKFGLYTIPQALWGIISTISYPEIIISYFVNGNSNLSIWDKVISYLSILLCIVFPVLIFRLFYLDKTFLHDKIIGSENTFIIFWLLLQVLFTVWWEPSNNEFWVLCLLPFILFVSEVPLGDNKKLVFYSIFLLSFVNLSGRVYKDSQDANNAVFSIIKKLDKSEIKNDDIILTFSTELKPYMEYFYHKRIRVFSLGRLQNSGVEKQLVINKYRNTLDSLCRIHTIFILENEIRPDNVVLTYYPQWSVEDYNMCYAFYNERLETIGYYNRFGKKSALYKFKSSDLN